MAPHGRGVVVAEKLTIRQLAQQGGLSKGTVSRIVNGKGQGFAEATRIRVLAAAEELGYRPSQAARALATGRTRIVALWLGQEGYYCPYLGHVYYHLQNMAAKDGYELISGRERVSPLGRSGRQETRRWPVDGVLAYELPPGVTAAAELVPEGTAVVGMGDWTDQATDYVALDLRTAAATATEHLLETGCTRVAHVRTTVVRTRTEGYEDAMREAGRTPEHIVLESEEHTREAGRKALLSYAAAHGCSDGLCCLNDEIAMGCFRAVLDLGLRVPEDVAIVGCDGQDYSTDFPFPISTLVIPVERLCALAWDALKRRIANPASPLRQVVLTPPLEVHASSGRCPTNGPLPVAAHAPR